LWSAVNTAMLRLGQFAVSVVIARLVSPHDFGVFVVALTVYLIVINVSEIGVSAALVREIGNADRIAPTVSTIAILSSAVLAAAMFVSAPVLATALGAPAAADAVRVLAVPLLLAGPTAVPAALLTRDFHQGRRLVTDSANFVVANGTLVVLAMNGSGVMALAWSRLAGQLVAAVLIQVVAPKRYRPGFDRREARRLLRFGAPLAGANLAGFGLANVDFVAIGRLAGPVSLGYYNLAYAISGWPSSIFTTILNSITLPAIARITGGVEELRRHVGAALAAVSAGALPVTAVCAVMAGPMIEEVYGARWAPAAPILAVVAVFGAIRVYVSLFSDVLVAVDRTRRLFHLQLLWLVVLVPTMFLAVHVGGGVGAAVAHVSVAILVVVPAYLVVLSRSAGLPARPMFRRAVVPAVGTTGAAALAHLAAGIPTSPGPRLVAGLVTFSVAYLVFLGRWLLALRRELVGLYGRRPDVPHPATAAGPSPERAGTIKEPL
jgi:PST family polysaccharide transporter